MNKIVEAVRELVAAARAQESRGGLILLDVLVARLTFMLLQSEESWIAGMIQEVATPLHYCRCVYRDKRTLIIVSFRTTCTTERDIFCSLFVARGRKSPQRDRLQEERLGMGE